ncbi:recombination protein F [Aquisphaera giovannonii]|uniref:Recombination protein F n=1 Tax=Aquisphaera giovannonii TaxID=406548 RepID=A0A5B9VY49_9BACT|nr:AAA family ATPase [Aquisphaera giovannonii]QEH32964.1 recombination protein F [Aquisphaera giovannonii]
MTAVDQESENARPQPADPPVLLDHITIEGYRSIRSLDAVELRPRNVLIGANGSGKSNFLSVFSFLRSIRQGKLASYTERAGGAERILHFGSKVTSSMRFALTFKGGVNGYHASLSPTSEDRFYVHDEFCSLWNRKTHASPHTDRLHGTGGEAGISGQQARVARWVQGHLDSWQKYHFHDTGDSSPMRKTASVNDNRSLRPDASNLAAYLYFLKTSAPSSYQLIRKTVQRAAPFFDDFHLEPLRLNDQTIRLEWIHKSSDQYFDAASLSDGTLRFICLSTLFAQPMEHRPSMIIVDEPELGLHPSAITLLASLIKSASRETQVIVSTQSALLLDHFEPEDVLVADLEDGATTLHRLDSNELAEWLEDYSLGQLWEKNQFGGRPGRG